MALTQKLGIVGRWLLQVFLAAVFIAVGLGKFGDLSWERRFDRWGYPSGSHVLVGVVELVAGALLLVPRLTTYAALLLAVVMFGAIVTHAVAGERWINPLPHLCLLLLVAFVRRRDRWRLGAVPAVRGETPAQS